MPEKMKNEEKSKKCLRETEIYSRVVGFFRPTKLWNKGKKEEFKDRKEYSLVLLKGKKEECREVV